MPGLLNMNMGVELGGPSHIQRFKIKGPDNEIKLFVGGLAY
jgi:hypothetical protein